MCRVCGYFSVAGRCDAELVGAEWPVPHSIVTRAEGPNDGVVSITSAEWGEHTEVWIGDHLNLVNWPNRLALKRGLWNELAPDYGRIVSPAGGGRVVAADGPAGATGKLPPTGPAPNRVRAALAPQCVGCADFILQPESFRESQPHPPSDSRLAVMEAAESQPGRVTNMQRMWRQLFAALAGVLAVVSAASAQSPGQITIPQPLPGGARPGSRSCRRRRWPARPIAPAGGQVYVRGSGGCNGCGSCGYRGPCGPLPTGRGCNNGCGSLKADCGFMFGSCKSFFDPCGVQPMGGGWGGEWPPVRW